MKWPARLAVTLAQQVGERKDQRSCFDDPRYWPVLISQRRDSGLSWLHG